MIDLVVLAVGPKTGGDHLNAHLAVGDTAALSFAVVVSFQFQAFVFLVAVVGHLVEDDFGVPDRLSVALLEHCDFYGSMLWIALLPGKGGNGRHTNNQRGGSKSTHDPYSTATRILGSS